jgi:hypothetical protein
MSDAHFATEPAAPPRPPVLLERLLSPQGIHALLGAGGLLFVVGLVTWLATLGIFDEPLVLATVLGAGNLVLLGVGFWFTLNTRHQLAGLAVTLLACLVMPLHLWFYHAQDLLTFENHLWAAALVISLLYSLTARVLQHWMFVPVFLGGVGLTSLLILADLGEFWQITAPAITLCVLGLVAIHVERFFSPDAESLFPREPFGLAFFWSGHALLGLGLLMVLVAQLAGGPLYETYTKSLYEQWNLTPTELVTTTNGKLLALALVLAGVYAHLYSDLVVRRKGYYTQIAAGLVLWGEFIVLDLFDFAVVYKLLATAVLGAVFTMLGQGLSRHEIEGRRIGKVMAGTGQWMFFIALLGTALLGLQALLASSAASPEVWSVFYALVLEAGLALLFFLRLSANDSARPLYLLFGVGHLALAALLMVTLLDLPLWRKGELASIALGLGLTLAGFIAWAREEAGDPKQASLSPAMLLGTLLIGVPMALTVLHFRTDGLFRIWDEASMLVVGLLLLAGGCVCQLRIPTIAGAAMTLLYVFGLLLFVRWGHLDTAALILAGGGATIFLLGLALSIFRDRLLALPTRVKERKGVFQVLGWR